MLCKATKRVSFPMEGATWDEFPWKGIPSERIRNHMGKKPDHFPKAEVKIAYNDMAVFLMFRVEDRYVRATAAAHQDYVYKDSCVEFFFAPGSDLSKGYFNLEMNCGGAMLFHFQMQPRKERIVIPESQYRKITIHHSLPRIVDPEIEEPVTWTVAYSIPLSLLRRYCQVVAPAPQVLWRVNFYKCADGTSHPHWLTWSPVDLPEPNFHYPQSFGLLQFE